MDFQKDSITDKRFAINFTMKYLYSFVIRGCLRFVIVVFPDHTHLLFFLLLPHTMFFNHEYGFTLPFLN